MTKTRRPDNLSFLLRLYRTPDNEETPHPQDETIWRVTLENARTRQRHGFASLEELFEFLQTQTDLSANENGGQDESRPQPGQARE